MTLHTYHALAHKTIRHWITVVGPHLSTEQARRLWPNRPARLALEQRVILALAPDVLTPGQIAQLQHVILHPPTTTETPP